MKEPESGETSRPQSQDGVAPDEAPPGDREPMLYCPVCSMRLTERKCKLFCARCGYYLSCADFY